MPTIVAGIRVATTTLVSLVTVASFVLPQGLGKSILDAVGNNAFKTELFAAGGLAVLLALFADAILVVAQRAVTPWMTAQRRR